MTSRQNGLSPPARISSFSLLAILILAVFSVGWLHPDEHFQILEFARWKLDPSNPTPLPWEFHYQMRPAIQPAIAVALSGLLSMAGVSDPFVLTLILRLLTGILSFTALWRIWRWFEPQIADPVLKRQFLYLSFLLWFTLYLAVRFSSETWSGAFFVIAFTFPFMGSKQGKLRFLTTGVLLGLAFITRYQAGLMVAGYMAWFLFVRKEKPAHLLMMATGFTCTAAAGVLVDRWFYGEWVLTAWNYLEQNILYDKVSGFGIHPWYFYFTELSEALIPPFSLVIILAFLLVFLLRRKDLLTWTLLPFLLVHLTIGHKETRFLFPLVWFVPVMLVKGATVVSSRYGTSWIRYRITGILMTVFWISNFILLTVLFFIPADRDVNLYQCVYHQKMPATLYFVKENPYRRALQAEFYRHHGLTIAEVPGVEALDSIGGTVYLALKTHNPDLSKLKHKRVHMVYSSMPEYVKYINFNHWLDRTRIWYVFRLD